MAKECALSTGTLPPGCLPRNSVVWINDLKCVAGPLNPNTRTTNHLDNTSLKHLL